MRYLRIFLISSLLLTYALTFKGQIIEVKASPSIHQGDLVLTGNNVTTIEGRFDINGSIIIEDNATLIMNNAIINLTISSSAIFLQNPSNGNPKLRATNTTIIGYRENRYFENSSTLFSNCTIHGFHYFNDESNVTIQDTIVYGNIQVRESSKITISNSTLEELGLVMYSANSSIRELSPGFYDSWDFWYNCSVVTSPSGRAPNATLKNTEIQNWSFSFQSSSNTEIYNAEINKIHANDFPVISCFNSSIYEIELYGNSVVKLLNTTHTVEYFAGEAKAYVSWYLNVHVLDSLTQDIPLANVSVTYPNTTLIESKLSNTNGRVKFSLLEKMMNTTAEYPIGNYTIKATYSIFTDNATVNMSNNQLIELKLEDFVISEINSLIILPLFIISTLLIILIHKKS